MMNVIVLSDNEEEEWWVLNLLQWTERKIGVMVFSLDFVRKSTLVETSKVNWDGRIEIEKQLNMQHILDLECWTTK